MTEVISADRFRDDESARNFLKGGLWPEGPVRPRCGVVDHACATRRAGVYRCAGAACRKDVAVAMKAVMERIHIALHKWLLEWLLAFHLMTSSRKGISAHRLHRTLAISCKAARFMAHRIREAMRAGGLAAPMSGEGEIVEADETYYGKVDEPKMAKSRRGRPYTRSGKSGPANKRPIVSLVERGGKIRSFHVEGATRANVAKTVRENVAMESHLHTDERRLYTESAASLPPTKRPGTALANTSAIRTERPFIPTASKAIAA